MLDAVLRATNPYQTLGVPMANIRTDIASEVVVLIHFAFADTLRSNIPAPPSPPRTFHAFPLIQSPLSVPEHKNDHKLERAQEQYERAVACASVSSSELRMHHVTIARIIVVPQKPC